MNFLLPLINSLHFYLLFNFSFTFPYANVCKLCLFLFEYFWKCIVLYTFCSHNYRDKSLNVVVWMSHSVGTVRVSVIFGERLYDIQLAYGTCHSTSAFFLLKLFKMGNYERSSLRNAELIAWEMCLWWEVQYVSEAQMFVFTTVINVAHCETVSCVCLYKEYCMHCSP